MSNKICGTCKFYTKVVDPNAIGEDSAECRRYPPDAFPMTQGNSFGVIQITRRVQKAHWCGEWSGLIKVQ